MGPGRAQDLNIGGGGGVRGGPGWLNYLNYLNYLIRAGN